MTAETITPAIKAQRAYRARRTQRLARMEAALEQIRDGLAGSPSDKGRKLHAVAEEALL